MPSTPCCAKLCFSVRLPDSLSRLVPPKHPNAVVPAPPRHQRPHPPLRRRDCALRPRHAGARGRAARADRAQRSGQDQRSELHFRALPPAGGTYRPDRPRRDPARPQPAAAPPHRRARRGTHLPEHRALQAHDGAGQPHAGPPRAHEGRRAQRRDLPGPPAAPGNRASALRGRDHRLHELGAGAERDRGHLGLREPAAGGDGARAGARSAHPAPGRAHGGYERGGEGGRWRASSSTCTRSAASPWW